MAEQNRYSEKDPQLWLETITNYLVGCAWEMESLLLWAESFQHNAILPQHVEDCRNFGCMDRDPVRLSSDLWTFLNLNLGTSLTVRTTFSNVPRLQGFEAWRRIVVPLVPKTAARRHDMHTKVHAPARTTRLDQVALAFESWDKQVRLFQACGGRAIPDDEKVTIALKMLPRNTPASMMLALRYAPTYEALKAACQDEITFLDEHGGLNNGVAHLVEPTPWSTMLDGEQEEQEEEEAGDGTNVLACFTGEQLVQIAAMPSESRDLVLAMGRNFKPRPKAKVKAKVKAIRDREPTPPKTAAAITAKIQRCANCHGEHSTRDCPKPEVKEQTCFKCGKTGHRAHQCREKAALAIANGGPAASSLQPVHLGMVAHEDCFACCVDCDGFTRPRKTVRLCDFGMQQPQLSQRQRKQQQRQHNEEQHNNRYAALTDSTHPGGHDGDLLVDSRKSCVVSCPVQAAPPQSSGLVEKEFMKTMLKYPRMHADATSRLWVDPSHGVDTLIPKGRNRLWADPSHGVDTLIPKGRRHEEHQERRVHFAVVGDWTPLPPDHGIQQGVASGDDEEDVQEMPNGNHSFCDCDDDELDENSDDDSCCNDLVDSSDDENGESKSQKAYDERLRQRLARHREAKKERVRCLTHPAEAHFDDVDFDGEGPEELLGSNGRGLPLLTKAGQRRRRAHRLEQQREMEQRAASYTYTTRHGWTPIGGKPDSDVESYIGANNTLDESSSDEDHDGTSVWELLNADNDQGDNLTKNRMGTLTPPTGGPSGIRTIPGVESKYIASSFESMPTPHGQCVAFNPDVSGRGPTADSPKSPKHEPNNSVSANRSRSLDMQRDKMLRSVLGDERYRIIEAIGAKGELMHALFPVLTEECDQQESGLFPMDTWADTFIEITLDS